MSQAAHPIRSAALAVIAHCAQARARRSAAQRGLDRIRRPLRRGQHNVQFDTFITFSVGTRLTGHLDRLLGGRILLRPRRYPRDSTCVIGWGLRGKSLEARAYARQHGLPFLCLEDGFIRSVGLGNTDPPLSIVWDDQGIYYAAGQPSRLEALIASPAAVDADARGSALAESWRRHRVSKYNHAGQPPALPHERFVLAIDQTAGDASIAQGLAGPESFQRMLEAALDEHPQLPVILKVHPDVIAGRKKAHFDALTPGQAARVTLLGTNLHAPVMFEPAEAVYVVTSQVGFEALVWQRPVRVFGMPFYAGWGLTRDELQAPERRRATGGTTLAGLVHAALVDYPRYVDPETLERCEPERVIEWMGLQRRMRERYPPRLQAIGFSTWKQPAARVFFGGSELAFVERSEDRRPDLPTIAWGRSLDSRGGDEPLGRVEDGFLRSVGLGADYVQPLSWVVDRSGMYYDATRASDLETCLQRGGFDQALLARARSLRERIVREGITKYNLSRGRWQRPVGRDPVVLVLGQVASDASIALGTHDVNDNRALLEAARRARPQAWLVYKPHPDVVAGRREDDLRGERMERLCDEVVLHAPMQQLIDQVDEVHVMTSLGGFEALLRGRAVMCHGQPFYAGWGLTEDRHPAPRRTRRLTLDELVAGTLILYPTYVSRVTGAFTTPERVLDELTDWRRQMPRRDPVARRLLRLAARWRDRWRTR